MLSEKTFFVFIFLTQNIRLSPRKILPLVWGMTEGVQRVEATEHKKAVAKSATASQQNQKPKQQMKKIVPSNGFKPLTSSL